MYIVEVQATYHARADHRDAIGLDQLDCIWIDAEPANEFGADFALVAPLGGIIRVITRVVDLRTGAAYCQSLMRFGIDVRVYEQGSLAIG